MALSRRRVLGGLGGVAGSGLLAACGGGGGGGGGSPAGQPTSPTPPPGTRSLTTIGSRLTGTGYPLQIYQPPASAGPRANLSLMVVLDGESWFNTLADLADARGSGVVIAAVHGAGVRSRDYVPANTCTSGGGGQPAYLEFLRQELLPFVQGSYGGHAERCALFGHSHGGSFVLYAMFAEAPGRHLFRSYLACDTSISCLPQTAYGWEQAYAGAHGELPVRLHFSWATQGNFAANPDYAAALVRRGWRGLTIATQAYNGTHNGIVPQVLADGLSFAFA